MPRPAATAAADFYDRWSDVLLAGAGPTFQAGLFHEEGTARPSASNVRLAERAGLHDALRVADLGCGVAGPAIDWCRRWSALHVDGLTISPRQARIAADRVLAAGLQERVTVQVGDYHAPPFSDGAYDAVLFVECLSYSDDLDAALRAAWNLLRPGGIVYIKDVVRPDGTPDPEEAACLAEFDELWAQYRTRSLAELVTATRGCGFIDLDSHPLPGLSSAHFLGSMFVLSASGIELSEMGQHFHRKFSRLPASFGDLRARRPPTVDAK